MSTSLNLAFIFFCVNSFSFTAVFAGGRISCGEVLGNKVGVIDYKSGENYTNWERCIWTIVIANISQVELQLIADGFNGNTNLITVYGLDDNLEIVPLLTLKAGDRAKHVVSSPVIYISFTTDYGFRGSGFFLVYQGLGEPNPNSPVYLAYHYTNLTGDFRYPGYIGGNDTTFISFTFMSVSSIREGFYYQRFNITSFDNGTDLLYRMCNYQIVNVYECGMEFVHKRASLCRYITYDVVVQTINPVIVTLPRGGSNIQAYYVGDDDFPD